MHDRWIFKYGVFSNSRRVGDTVGAALDAVWKFWGMRGHCETYVGDRKVDYNYQPTKDETVVFIDERLL